MGGGSGSVDRHARDTDQQQSAGATTGATAVAAAAAPTTDGLALESVSKGFSFSPASSSNNSGNNMLRGESPLQFPSFIPTHANAGGLYIPCGLPCLSYSSM